jgi:predicted dehydrogenase
MERVRLGLIGAGGMANAVHYPSLAEMHDVDLVALCDLDEERLTRTADRFSIQKRYRNHKDMLDSEQVDAVYVLMPPHQLFDPVMDALERGKHVFIEKPPAITSDQCRQLAVVAERQRLKTMVAFNRRYIPVMARAKEIVVARGPVIQCVSTFYKNYIDQPPYYRGAVDILTSDMIHAVDALRWMADSEVADVVSDLQARNASYTNMFNALVSFESGCVGALLGNWNVGGRRHVFEIHGEGISAYCNPDETVEVWADAKEPLILSSKEIAGSDENRVYYGFAAENRHFIDSLKSDSMPITNFSDALKTMLLVDMIYLNAWN